MLSLPHEDYPAKEFLREAELAQRWRVSGRTLQRWRRSGSGPPWLKFGGRIVYSIGDIVAAETDARRKHSARGASI